MSGSDHRCPYVNIGTPPAPKGNEHWQATVWLAEKTAKEAEDTIIDFSTKQSNRKHSHFGFMMQKLTGKCWSLHKRVNTNKTGPSQGLQQMALMSI